jgi:MFS family permease
MPMISKLAIISFIASMSAALISTIWSLYIDTFFKDISYVGFFISFFMVVSFLSYFLLIPFIEKNSKSKIYAYSLFFLALVFLGIALFHSLWIFSILVFIMVIFSSLKITSFGLMVKHKSNKRRLASYEGVLYTFMNLSFLIGPIIAGFVAQKFGFSYVFLLASLFLIFGLFLFINFKVKDVNSVKRVDSNFYKNFKEFFNNKSRFFAYLIGGGVNLWWTLIYVLIPLYIVRQGLDDIAVGYFLFAVMIPPLISEYYFGKKASLGGFKRLFKIGYFILGVSSLICFFINDVYLVLFILVLAGFGISMVEPTSEAYFLDLLKTKKEQNRFYGPYSTTIELNHFLGLILSSVLLLFVDFEFVFLLFAFLMFCLFFVSCRIKNIIEVRKK